MVIFTQKTLFVWQKYAFAASTKPLRIALVKSSKKKCIGVVHPSTCCGPLISTCDVRKMSGVHSNTSELIYQGFQFQPMLWSRRKFSESSSSSPPESPCPHHLGPFSNQFRHFWRLNHPNKSPRPLLWGYNPWHLHLGTIWLFRGLNGGHLFKVWKSSIWATFNKFAHTCRDWSR